jgi:hypothetical protein
MPKKIETFICTLRGSFVNGSSLISGLETNMDSGLSITGGCVVMMHVLKNTCLLQGRSKEGEVVLIGFYGSTLEISYASYGGWIPWP